MSHKKFSCVIGLVLLASAPVVALYLLSTLEEKNNKPDIELPEFNDNDSIYDDTSSDSDDSVIEFDANDQLP